MESGSIVGERVAISVRGVAGGEDPEDRAARAEGAIVLPHDLRHPEREAWARWRLLTAAHEFGARALLGRGTLRLTPKAGGPLAPEVAEKLEAAARGAISEAFGLAELKVEALDELEPEDAGDDPAVAALVEQHGVVLRVCDKACDNPDDTITLRVTGPPAAAQDAASLLSARYIDARATSSVLQLVDQVQNMTAEMAGDFAADLREMEVECKVKVEKGRSALWVCGDSEAQVADARRTLQEMLVYYLPSDFCLQQDVSRSVIARLRGDADLGVLMARPDCAVMLDEPAESVWICGKQRAAVQRRISELSRLPPLATDGEDGLQLALKRRRTNALSFHSESVG